MLASKKLQQIIHRKTKQPLSSSKQITKQTPAKLENSGTPGYFLHCKCDELGSSIFMVCSSWGHPSAAQTSCPLDIACVRDRIEAKMEKMSTFSSQTSSCSPGWCSRKSNTHKTVTSPDTAELASKEWCWWLEHFYLPQVTFLSPGPCHVSCQSWHFRMVWQLHSVWKNPLPFSAPFRHNFWAPSE